MLSKVSVIIPVYNSGKCLEELIDSILNQTCKDISIILVDDGSDDGSGEICDKYAKDYQIITTIHQNNGGQNSARYRGLEEAQTEYVLFLDSDDWIEKDYIQQMMSLVENIDVDFATSGLVFEYSNELHFFQDGIDEGIYFQEDIYSKILGRYLYDVYTGRHGITHSLCNKIIKRDLAERALREVDSELRIGEDGAAVLLLLLNAKKIRISHYCGYHYIQHEDSIIHTYDDEYLWRIKHLNIFYNDVICRYGVNKEIDANAVIRFVAANAENALQRTFGYIKKSALEIPKALPERCNRVIVYGAGLKGREFVEDLLYDGRYKIVAWVDKNYDKIFVEEFEIVSPANIAKYQYDYIFIAIFDRLIAKKVENDLVKMGVPSEKVWILDIIEKYIAK